MGLKDKIDKYFERRKRDADARRLDGLGREVGRKILYGDDEDEKKE